MCSYGTTVCLLVAGASGVLAAPTSPAAMVKRMGIGINLGNTLDAPTEGSWAPAAQEWAEPDQEWGSWGQVLDRAPDRAPGQDQGPDRRSRCGRSS